MVRTRDDLRQQAKAWDRVRQWLTHKRNRQLERTDNSRRSLHSSENILKILSCCWKIHRRGVPLWEDIIKQFYVSLSTSCERQERTGSSVSDKAVNTSTLLLCGVFDAAKGRLRIDQAVDKGGAETRQQRCRMRVFVYRHRSRRNRWGQNIRTVTVV